MKFIVLVLIASIATSAHAKTSRWTQKEAAAWDQAQTWHVGANFIPHTAINQIEMWDASTFDALVIDRELGEAERLGMTSMRVFLHDLLWKADSAGFAKRIDAFLTIASHHHIRPLLVLFDSCWNPSPHLGLQPIPTPGVHNSGWVQSPGLEAMMNPNERARLKAYVTGLIGRFANDSRILGWDLWNEPDNLNGASSDDPQSKQAAVLDLLPLVFAWARSVDPAQPLTSGIWNGDWSSDSSLRTIEKLQLDLSDVISFHDYEPAANFEVKVTQLERYDRPLLLTEYMARPLGSTLETILPVAKAHKVHAFNWGFVAGKTQTYFPWDSWQHPYPTFPPVWFHDLLYEDGHPYDVNETRFLQTITGVMSNHANH